MVKTQVVSLQSFGHFDVIFMVDESIDHGKSNSICFLPQFSLIFLTFLFQISLKIVEYARMASSMGLSSYQTRFLANQRARIYMTVVKLCVSTHMTVTSS